MSRLFQRLDDRGNALAQAAQPIIVALGTAGLTGGMLAAAGVVTGRMMRRTGLRAAAACTTTKSMKNGPAFTAGVRGFSRMSAAISPGLQAIVPRS